MKKIIIAAVSENGVIGKDGDIPWNIPKDMEHFKETTIGNPVIMGRKTYQSFPETFRPLPGRTNIVLTRSDFQPDDDTVKVAYSLEEAYSIADKLSEKAFIIGGSTVYEQALKDAEKMILTEVKKKVDGDIFFPEWNKEAWKEINRDKRDCFDFVEYVKK